MLPVAALVHIRKYKEKLLVKPAKQNVLSFVNNIKAIIKKHPTMAAGDLIRILNPKIIGWGNYYKHVVAKQTFGYIDNQIFKSLYKWSKKRHSNKSTEWIIRKYYGVQGYPKWIFQGKTLINNQITSLYLAKMSKIPIKRHIKIKGNANPFDPDYAEYLQRRSNRKNWRNTWAKMPMAAL
ncbi:group II intron maturase-specific domain-containing protein [Zooshikella ganghwensis]|uniref:group II intron maturase-specific domain-containing protein n=1 Tax=Zooshikella ganghwensis TaxID=202772 RepID=UPI00048089E2|nr:group II intron maturase-specific domain-containing protein [Zooshikella ganghwensis]